MRGLYKTQGTQALCTALVSAHTSSHNHVPTWVCAEEAHTMQRLSRHAQLQVRGPWEDTTNSSSSKPAVKVLLLTGPAAGQNGMTFLGTHLPLPTCEHGHLSCADHTQAHHTNEGI
jgi:hypothetical protein